MYGNGKNWWVLDRKGMNMYDMVKYVRYGN